MVTINKAAELTGIKYSALRRWIKMGEFKYYVMVGSKYLINLERLGEFLNTPAKKEDRA
jgi:excisionase family DNA binding protein